MKKTIRPIIILIQFDHRAGAKFKGISEAPPGSVFFEVDGDSNPYFPNNPRILDNFLKLIEPKWERVVKELKEGDFNSDTFTVIAGYISYLRTCTLTGKRLGQSLYEKDIQNYRPALAKWVSKNPETYGASESLIKGLLSKDIRVIVDPHFPHALSIKNLGISTYCLLNSHWEIIFNNNSKPFLTSDNPATSIHIDGNNNHNCIYLPLTPTLAVLIHLNLCDSTKIIDFLKKDPNEIEMLEFIKEIRPFFRTLLANDEMVENFNRRIVQCAEDKIFSNIQAEWIANLVQEYQCWRVEVLNEKTNPSIYQLKLCAMERSD